MVVKVCPSDVRSGFVELLLMTACFLPLPAASNESLCPSHTKLTGTTTIVAKPGLGAVMRDMIATMPGACNIVHCTALLLLELAVVPAFSNKRKLGESEPCPLTERSCWVHMHWEKTCSRVTTQGSLTSIAWRLQVPSARWTATCTTRRRGVALVNPPCKTR